MYKFVERNSCPVCEHTQRSILYVEKFKNGLTGDFIQKYYQGRISERLLGDAEYMLAKCENCSLIFQIYILDDAGMADLYERAIDPEHSLKKREQAKPKYFNALILDTEKIGKFLPNITPQNLRVLDFGMGWGHWCVTARSRGYNVMGAELSDRRIQYALSNGTHVIDPFSPENNHLFDFINTDQVFEHLPSPSEMIGKLAKKLSSGGILKIFVPNSTRDELSMRFNLWSPRKDAFHPLEHINCYNRLSLNKLASTAGLKPVSIFHPALKRKVFSNILRRSIGIPGWYFVKTDN